MTTPIFIQNGDTYHTMIVGTSGKGKSVLLQAEALRLGISYDELLRRMELKPEQKERERMRQVDEDRVEEERLNAVREAFWSLTPPGHHDFDCLHDVLVASELAEDPTPSQVKAFFMMLPPDIVGSAISWGFGDTEVRERAYEFLRENKKDVVARCIEGAK